MSPEEYELRLAAKRIRRLVKEARMWPHVRVEEAQALQTLIDGYPQLGRAIGHLISALDAM